MKLHAGHGIPILTGGTVRKTFFVLQTSKSME